MEESTVPPRIPASKHISGKAISWRERRRGKLPILLWSDQTMRYVLKTIAAWQGHTRGDVTGPLGLRQVGAPPLIWCGELVHINFQGPVDRHPVIFMHALLLKTFPLKSTLICPLIVSTWLSLCASNNIIMKESII